LGLIDERYQESVGNYERRRLMTCVFIKTYSDDEIEKNEMGGACSTYGARRSVYRV
jgi:hypothetical protein